MKTYKHHFLDANIVLAMVLPDDSNYKRTKEYFNYECNRYISDTVSTESKNKIKKIRRISLKITDYAKEYSNNSKINALKIDKHLLEVKKGFLKQYDNNPFPEDLKKEKFDALVSNFIKEFSTEITNILINGNNDELNDIIISSFRTSICKLYNFLKENKCIEFIENANKYQLLRKIGIDKTDAILLEESYILYMSLKQTIYFITFDNGIIILDDEIKKILTNNVCITHPKNYYTA